MSQFFTKVEEKFLYWRSRIITTLYKPRVETKDVLEFKEELALLRSVFASADQVGFIQPEKLDEDSLKVYKRLKERCRDYYYYLMV